NGTGGGNPVRTFSASPNLPIPDNDATGVTSTMSVPDSLTVSAISVSTVIPHTYKGDLVVSLIGPDGTTGLLHNSTGGTADTVRDRDRGGAVARRGQRQEHGRLVESQGPGPRGGGHRDAELVVDHLQRREDRQPEPRDPRQQHDRRDEHAELHRDRNRHGG